MTKGEIAVALAKIFQDQEAGNLLLKKARESLSELSKQVNLADLDDHDLLYAVIDNFAAENYAFRTVFAERFSIKLKEQKRERKGTTRK